MPYEKTGPAQGEAEIDFAARWARLKGHDYIVDARRFQANVCGAIEEPEERFVSFPLLPELQFAPGELTVWGGENGSGKSLLLGQITMSLLKQGQRVCVLSFEMAPEETILRMMRQSFGRRPTVEEAVAWFKAVGGRLFLYQYTGAIDPAACFGCCHYAATEPTVKCGQIVVDNLMMLTSGRDSDQNMAAQKEVAATLKAVAMATRSHIHLVAHLRKRDRESAARPVLPTKNDIAGTSNVANIADNIVLVARNPKKVAACNGEEAPNEAFDDANPDVFLKLDKNRRSGTTRRVACWYDPLSMQFCPTAGRFLMELLPSDLLSASFGDSRKVPAVKRMMTAYNKSFKGDVR